MPEFDRRRFLASALAAALLASDAAGALAAEVTPRSVVAPEAIFAALIRALMAFDDPRFPAISPEQLVERVGGITNILVDPAYRSGLAAFDGATPAGFAALPLDAARSVVHAWLSSPNALQRAFVAATRNVAVIALYSDPRAWPAIGYAGPFDPNLRGGG